MNVLFVASSKYPDRDEIKERLRKGLATEHVTWIRPKDHWVKKIVAELHGEVREFESQYGFKGDALEEEMLNFADQVIVYHDGTAASKSGFYVKKARTHPYSLIFGPKVHITEKKRKAAPVKRKPTRRAE